MEELRVYDCVFIHYGRERDFFNEVHVPVMGTREDAEEYSREYLRKYGGEKNKECYVSFRRIERIDFSDLERRKGCFRRTGKGKIVRKSYFGLVSLEGSGNGGC